MSISLTKRNFLYQITLLTLIAGWVGAGILHYLLPGHYFGGYPFIPVYFFLFGLFEISMFDACSCRICQLDSSRDCVLQPGSLSFYRDGKLYKKYE